MYVIQNLYTWSDEKVNSFVKPDKSNIIDYSDRELESKFKFSDYNVKKKSRGKKQLNKAEKNELTRQ